MYRNSEKMEKGVGNAQWRTRGWLLILSICLIFGVTSTAIFGMFRGNPEPKEAIIEGFSNLLDSDTLDITLTSGLEGFDLEALKEKAHVSIKNSMEEIMTIIENGLGSNLEILHRMMY